MRFARKFSDIGFFLKTLPLKDDELSIYQKCKINGGAGGFTDFVLGRTCPEERLNLSKSFFLNPGVQVSRCCN